jgi:hypothetical protein
LTSQPSTIAPPARQAAQRDKPFTRPPSRMSPIDAARIPEVQIIRLNHAWLVGPERRCGIAFPFPTEPEGPEEEGPSYVAQSKSLAHGHARISADPGRKCCKRKSCMGKPTRRRARRQRYRARLQCRPRRHLPVQRGDYVCNSRAPCGGPAAIPMIRPGSSICKALTSPLAGFLLMLKTHPGVPCGGFLAV